MQDDEKAPEVSDPSPAEQPEPATGERSDHEASPPGVEIPPDDEPEPGEHPAP
jgi:hypothetical protein